MSLKEIFNKGKRKIMYSGGEIRPDTSVIVEKEEAEKLKNLFPTEILDRQVVAVIDNTKKFSEELDAAKKEIGELKKKNAEQIAEIAAHNAEIADLKNRLMKASEELDAALKAKEEDPEEDAGDSDEKPKKGRKAKGK